jgi:putative thioredoxin
MSTATIDVTDATFDEDVLRRSETVTVVVDFWAPWCGPCRTIGPILERLAEEHEGELVLAKVNVDENPAVASSYGIRSIPAVKAFRGGELVDEFVGAVPERVARQFVDRLLPTEADRHAAAGVDAERRGAAVEAENSYRQAVDLDPNHPLARLGLGRLLEDGNPDAALGELERVLPGTRERAEADRIAARIRLGREEGGGEEEVRAQLTANPRDLPARLQLARLLAAREAYDEALAELLEIVRADRAFEDGAARKAMLDVFEVLGPRHPLAERYRDQLAKVLFA